MSKRLFISSFFFFLFLSTNVFPAEKAQQIQGPITITSEMLTADNKAHTALFEKSVVAKTTDMTIFSDKMLVYYNENTGNIKKIEAKDNVKLIKANRVITSKEATYYADGDKIVFTGEPRALEGENIVTGSKMTYLLSDDRFLVEDSKVFLQRKKE